MSALAIQAVGAVPAADASSVRLETTAPAHRAGATSFSQLVFDGIDKVNQKVIDADAMVKAFVLDDNVPPHRVTYALEQSRVSLELMMQVRSRLVEGYQEIMRMQL